MNQPPVTRKKIIYFVLMPCFLRYDMIKRFAILEGFRSPLHHLMTVSGVTPMSIAICRKVRSFSFFNLFRCSINSVIQPSVLFHYFNTYGILGKGHFSL